MLLTAINLARALSRRSPSCLFVVLAPHILLLRLAITQGRCPAGHDLNPYVPATCITKAVLLGACAIPLIRIHNRRGAMKQQRGFAAVGCQSRRLPRVSKNRIIATK